VSTINTIKIDLGDSALVHIVDQNDKTVDQSAVSFELSSNPVTALDPGVATVVADGTAGFKITAVGEGSGVVRFGYKSLFVDLTVTVPASVTAIGVVEGPAA
jgi:hypothetical protein